MGVRIEGGPDGPVLACSHPQCRPGSAECLARTERERDQAASEVKFTITVDASRARDQLGKFADAFRREVVSSGEPVVLPAGEQVVDLDHPARVALQQLLLRTAGASPARLLSVPEDLLTGLISDVRDSLQAEVANSRTSWDAMSDRQVERVREKWAGWFPVFEQLLEIWEESQDPESESRSAET